LIVATLVKVAHPHAAQSQSGHQRTTRTQLTLNHLPPPKVLTDASVRKI